MNKGLQAFLLFFVLEAKRGSGSMRGSSYENVAGLVIRVDVGKVPTLALAICPRPLRAFQLLAGSGRLPLESATVLSNMLTAR